MAVPSHTPRFMQLKRGATEKSSQTLPSLSHFAPFEAFKFAKPQSTSKQGRQTRHLTVLGEVA